MQGNILIHGATMVLPKETVNGDLRIRDGVIAAISTSTPLKPLEDELFLDRRGLHLLPGMIDPQCHFRDPGQPEKEDLGSGSAAAVGAGTAVSRGRLQEPCGQCQLLRVLLSHHCFPWIPELPLLVLPKICGILPLHRAHAIQGHRLRLRRATPA